jgi:hypothetical protein
LQLAHKTPTTTRTSAQTVIQYVRPAMMELAARRATQVQLVLLNTSLAQLAWLHVPRAIMQIPLSCANNAIQTV